MNAQAVTAALNDLYAWPDGRVTYPESWITHYVQKARDVLAGGTYGAMTAEDARRLIAAADAPAPAPAPASVPQPIAGPESTELILGVLPDGAVMTEAACRKLKADPVEYLKNPEATLTHAGRVALQALEEIAAADPERRKRAHLVELGIDPAAIKAACTSWNRDHPGGPRHDFETALKAEIHNRELVAADRARAR